MTRPLGFVILSQEELDKLRDWMRSVTLKNQLRIRLRGNMVLMSHQLKTVPQIARALNRSPRTVYQWLRRYRQNGLAGIMSRAYSRRLNHDQVQELLKVSRWYLVGAHTREFHKRWTFRRMSEWVKETYGIILSPNRIRQVVRETLSSGDIPDDDKPTK